MEFIADCSHAQSAICNGRSQARYEITRFTTWACTPHSKACSRMHSSYLRVGKGLELDAGLHSHRKQLGAVALHLPPARLLYDVLDLLLPDAGRLQVVARKDNLRQKGRGGTAQSVCS